MPEFLTIILLTGAAGLCIPLGGAIASVESIRPGWVKNELRHFVIALGGGILLGAVTIVLVPEGMDGIGDSVWGIFFILSGGLIFFVIERYLGSKHQEAPQLMGMLLDYVPEAIALGGLIVSAPSLAPLLALLIGMQNLPEGFNAYREVICTKQCSPRKTLLFMTWLALLGPVAGLIGYYFLAGDTAILAAIMLFASGGILYLIFQDIAPQSRLEKHWGPPLGAVLGFCIALFSETLVVYS